MSLRGAWQDQADNWIAWARRPGHDSYWQFHRDAFLPLVPPPGRLTLDVGCGEGRVSRDLADAGHRVLGLDASAAMVGAARAVAGPPAVVADAAALPVPDGAADCAVAFMSLHDVDDLDAAVGELARVLAPGGRLVMAIVHPVNSAGYFEEDGRPDGVLPPFVIREPYLSPRRYSDPVERDGLTMRFDSMHRPLQDYSEALFREGFVIERLREPAEPDPSSKWAALPLFLHLRAVRNGQRR